MKRVWIAALVGALVATAALADEREDMSYLIGTDIGQSLLNNGVDVDLDALVEGMRTILEGGESRLSAEETMALQKLFREQQQSAMQARQQEMEARTARESAANAAQGKTYRDQNADRDGVRVTDSGLQYRVIEAGSGERPGASDTVRVHYRGTLVDGTEFDSSYSRDEPTEFALDAVIPGWTEGLQLMPVGSKYEFVIPHELAYGDQGGGSIPPGSTLIFEVELLDIL